MKVITSFEDLQAYMNDAAKQEAKHAKRVRRREREKARKEARKIAQEQARDEVTRETWSCFRAGTEIRPARRWRNRYSREQAGTIGMTMHDVRVSDTAVVVCKSRIY